MKEFELLSALMQASSRIVRRDELIARVWQGELPDDSNTVDVHVANLRKKLQAAGAGKLLRTVRGYGYSLSSSGEDSAARP